MAPSGPSSPLVRVPRGPVSCLRPLLVDAGVAKAKEAKSIPYKGKFKPKIRYIHQGGKNPHILTLHGNSLEKLEGSYQRFLTNFFHKKLNLSGITIKLKFINSKNPYN